MGRVVKLAAERKEELVDCAEALFFEKGYEAATIADIIARAGVSKGGFYHHFASKEELLDALTEKISRQVIAAAHDILADRALDALTRLNRFFVRGQQWKIEAAPQLRALYQALFRPENTVLYQRMVRVAFDTLAPVLEEIVEQGRREGLFDPPDTRIAAEILLHMSNARHGLFAQAFASLDTTTFDEAVGALEERLKLEEAVVNRILGVKTGSVHLVEPGFIKAALTAFR